MVRLAVGQERAGVVVTGSAPDVIRDAAHESVSGCGAFYEVDADEVLYMDTVAVRPEADSVVFSPPSV